MLSTVALFASTPLAGATSNENVASKNVKVDNLAVTVFSDGRINGIKNPENLSQETKRKLLKIMRFTDAEIDEYPDSFENSLLADGGIKVDVKSEMTRIYTDSKGVDHIYTPESEEEINQLRELELQERLAQLGEETTSNITIVSDGIMSNGVQDGKFTGNGVLVYLGDTATEYKYKYRTAYDWSSKPTLCFSDAIGTAWQSHTTSVSSSYHGTYTKIVGGNTAYFPEPLNYLDQSSVYGTRAEFDIVNEVAHHYGYLEDEVRIPKTHVNETGQFASGYGHSWYPQGLGGISITVKSVGIEFSGTQGDRWSWRNTFTIGGSILS